MTAAIAAACLLLVVGCGAADRDAGASREGQPAATTRPVDIGAATGTTTPPPPTPAGKAPPLRPVNDNCPPRSARILLRERHAAVYRDPNAGEIRDLFACSDYRQAFEFTNDSIAFPPAMDLHGLLLAWVAGSRDDGAGIRVSPLRNAQAVGNLEFPHPMRIGSLRVSRHGTVVWIGCTLPRALWDDFMGNGRTPPPLGAAPNCVRPGPAINTVYLQTARESNEGIAPRVLDRGAQLDPRSLRRAGNLMSWLRAGKRHHHRIASNR